jgi:hypothetical protein
MSNPLKTSYSWTDHRTIKDRYDPKLQEIEKS